MDWHLFATVVVQIILVAVLVVVVGTIVTVVWAELKKIDK